MTPDECYQLAVALAPEVRDRLAIIHDPEWPAPPGCSAWTSLGRNLAVRDALMADGRWPGHFPTTIIFIAEPTIELLAHELAHCLPICEPLADIEPTPMDREVQAVQVRSWAAGNHYRDPDRLPWTGHDARWIRRLIHLWHRLERLGMSVRPIGLQCAGYNYGLARDEHAYRFALNAEPYGFYGATFKKIEAAPIPDLFARMFADDCRDYLLNTLIGD